MEPNDSGCQQGNLGNPQSSQPIALNQLQASGGVTNPVGPIMKVKNFRINIVFASSVSVLWALVYVPEGLPIGTLSTGSVVTSPLHLCTNLSSS